MKSRAVVAWIASILLIASSVAHAFLGLPPLQDSLRRAGVDADVMETVTVGWLFGSAAMMAFGLIMLFRALRLSRGREVDRAPGLVIAFCYVVFGVTAFLSTGMNPHFLGFILIGVLAAGSALGRRQGEPLR